MIQMSCKRQIMAQISAKAWSVNISVQLCAATSVRFRSLQTQSPRKSKAFLWINNLHICLTKVWGKSWEMFQDMGREERKDTRRNIGFVSCYISFSSCAASLSWWLQAPIKSCVRRTRRPPGAARYKKSLPPLLGCSSSVCDVFPRAWLLPRHCH